jgi:hypothetical protein
MTAPGEPNRPDGRRRVWCGPSALGAIPPLAEGFIARPETVPGLEYVLLPGAAVALVPGGSVNGGGKTSLASCLAHSLWRARSVEVLAWIAAHSRASVLAGYGQGAAELGLDYGGDAEAAAARVLAWLSGTSRPWLVVPDELRDAADLDGLWPQGPAGQVLITAADAAVMPGERRVQVHVVPAFSTREAMSYLSGRLTTEPDQRGGAIDLAADLGCDPAALAQAAAVIASTGISCREYRGYFVQRQAEAGGGNCDPPAAAWFTWTAAASHAERLAPGAGTWRLLVPGGCWYWPRCSTSTASPSRCSLPRPSAVPVRPGHYMPAGSAAGAGRAAGPAASRAGDRRRDSRVGEPGGAGRGPLGSTAGPARPDGPGRRGCAG